MTADTPRAKSIVPETFADLQPEYEDYKFIEWRISQQYLNQYHGTYALA